MSMPVSNKKQPARPNQNQSQIVMNNSRSRLEEQEEDDEDQQEDCLDVCSEVALPQRHDCSHYRST